MRNRNQPKIEEPLKMDAPAFIFNGSSIPGSERDSSSESKTMHL